MQNILQLSYRACRRTIRNPADALLLIRMAAWVCVISLAVRLRPLPKALSLVSIPTRPREVDQSVEQNLASAIDRILKTNRLCFKPVCWKRAAVLHRYLSLNGIPTRIVFGVRKESNETLHGHAWLEHNEEPILEVEAPNYKVTYIFPSDDRFELDLGLLNG